MSDLPNSNEEKQAAFKKDFSIEHWMYVHELRSMLEQFRPTDWVEPNKVGNLVIQREGTKGFWVISMAHTSIDDYTEGEIDEQRQDP